MLSIKENVGDVLDWTSKGDFNDMMNQNLSDYAHDPSR